MDREKNILDKIFFHTGSPCKVIHAVEQSLQLHWEMDLETYSVINTPHMFLIYLGKKGYKQIMKLSKVLMSEKINIFRGQVCYE